MEDHKHHANHSHSGPAHEPAPTAAPVAAASRDYSALYVPGAILIAGAIIGVSLIFALKGSSSGAQAANGQPPAVKVNVKDIAIEDNDPYIGDKNAPVTLVVWEDYQCPFCKAVEVGHDQIQVKPAMPELVRDYVNTGKLRIVFKDYAFLGDDSKMAALYDNAVWKLYPAKYYEWREAMFHAQDEEHAGFGTESTILALIKKIPGMDSAKLKADVTANVAAYTKEMDDDREEGAKNGISGTPGFITGKVLIPGAVGIEQFKAAIDPQL